MNDGFSFVSALEHFTELRCVWGRRDYANVRAESNTSVRSPYAVSCGWYVRQVQESAELAGPQERGRPG
jgi:hypothetical protein